LDKSRLRNNLDGAGEAARGAGEVQREIAWYALGQEGTKSCSKG